MKKTFIFLCLTLIGYWFSFASISDLVTDEEYDPIHTVADNTNSLTESEDGLLENSEDSNLLSDVKDTFLETVEDNKDSSILSDIKDDLTKNIESWEDSNLLKDLEDSLIEKSNNDEDSNLLIDIKNEINNTYSDEFNDAYDFAFNNDITTMDSIDEANMEWWLTRIAMAKMLSNYAMNILWKKPANIVVPKFKDVSEKLNEDYGWAVDLAYQLWIMWIWIDNFRPYDPVTRAEFVTALSRMLYWLADWLDKYYTTHMEKLKEEGIISNTDPNLKELRWYVMIMLMRSAKDKLWALKERIENRLAEDLELLRNA